MQQHASRNGWRRLRVYDAGVYGDGGNDQEKRRGDALKEILESLGLEKPLSWLKWIAES